jgi:hypothetical protein
MKTIILNWSGPYSLAEVREDRETGNGLYLLTGKRRYERNSTIQYCGITEKTFSERFRNHHKIFEITKEQKIWLAEVEYPKNFDRGILEMAEKIIIWTWQLPSNDKKKVSPSEPVTILHFWFNKNGKPRRNQVSILKGFSDVLSWNGKLWRSGNLKVEEF